MSDEKQLENVAEKLIRLDESRLLIVNAYTDGMLASQQLNNKAKEPELQEA